MVLTSAGHPRAAARRRSCWRPPRRCVGGAPPTSSRSPRPPPSSGSAWRWSCARRTSRSSRGSAGGIRAERRGARHRPLRRPARRRSGRVRGACSTVAGLLMAWHQVDVAGHLFHALVLVVLAGMVGFCLAGDLFTAVRLLRADGRQPRTRWPGSCVQERAPLEGSLELRGEQLGRFAAAAHRHRAALRAHGRAEPRTDRRRPRPPPARCARRRRLRARRVRLLRQGGDRALSLLARRRLRGGPDVDLPDLRRGAQRARPLRRRAGVLDGLLGPARAARRDGARRPPRPWPRHGADRRRHVRRPSATSSGWWPSRRSATWASCSAAWRC